MNKAKREDRIRTLLVKIENIKRRAGGKGVSKEGYKEIKRCMSAIKQHQVKMNKE